MPRVKGSHYASGMCHLHLSNCGTSSRCPHFRVSHTQRNSVHPAVPLTPEYSVPKSDTTARTLIRTSRMSPTLPTIPRHIQLGNVIQMPLESLLKKLDHRQQLSRPGKGDTVSVCTYGESVSVAKTKWLGYLAHRFRARGNPVYTWTSAAVHVT